MASTVGHSLAGLAIYLALTRPPVTVPRLWAERKRVAAVMALANLPDIDFLIGGLLYRDPHWMHGRITHGVPFALLVALVLALTIPAGPSVSRAFGVYAAVITSHAVIDLFTSPFGISWHWTGGVPLLLPLVDRRFSAPLGLFPGVAHRGLDQLMSLHNVMVVLYELAVFLTVIGLILRFRREPAV